MSIATIKNFALTLSKTAGHILLEHFGTGVRHHYKEENSANVCSEADLAANSYITSMIAKEFPHHGILSEEMPAVQEQAEYLWVIDPLDGTNNFVHGLPQFSVSIAVLHNRIPEFGVVYQPVGDQLYVAERGSGATLNGERIFVSQNDSLDQALIGLGFYYERGETMRATLRAIEDYFAAHVHGVRRFGCASLDLCYVASGRFDAFFEYTLSPWDYAAGMLIVEEAGGKVSDARGKPLQCTRSSVFAASDNLYDAALAIAQRHTPKDTLK